MDELEFNPITTSYHAFIKHRGCARSLKALCECPLPFTLIKYVLNRVSWSKAHKSQSSADAWRLPIDIMDMLWFTASLFNGGYYVWGAGMTGTMEWEEDVSADAFFNISPCSKTDSGSLDFRFTLRKHLTTRSIWGERDEKDKKEWKTTLKRVCWAKKIEYLHQLPSS